MKIPLGACFLISLIGSGSARSAPALVQELAVSRKAGESGGASEADANRRLFRRELTDSAEADPKRGAELLSEADRAKSMTVQRVTPTVSNDVNLNYRAMAVAVGPSHESEKCIRAAQPVMCPPNAGNKGIRLNKDGLSEEYDITVSGGIIVCVRRTDTLAGWDSQLEIECIRQAVMTVTLGSSTDDLKCLEMEERLACTSNAANPGIRYTNDGGEDYVFSVQALPMGDWETKRTNVCVQRTDEILGKPGKTGWDFELEISCAIIERPFKFLSRNIPLGKSTADNSACYTVPLRNEMVSCPTNAAEWNSAGSLAFEVVTDYAFETPPVSGTRICARRVDKLAGWDQDLELTCSALGEVNLGSSLFALKCITLDQPVKCISAAGDAKFRINKDGGFETFDITSSGYTVCARRTDAADGWSYNLRVGCVPDVGYKPHAPGSAGMTIAQHSSRRRREPRLLALDVTRADEASAIFDGDLVWLGHGNNRWLGCLNDVDCVANKRQAPSRFRLFMNTNRSHAPLASGREVWILDESTSNYLKCDTNCQSMSRCPSEKDFASCLKERWVIYSAAGEVSAGGISLIRDGDTVWFQGFGNKMLSCSTAGEPCLSNGMCATASQDRTVTKDVGCTKERFRIYKAHVNGASKVKEPQAIAINIGASDTREMCTALPGQPVYCAANAGDEDFRAAVEVNPDKDNPFFNISVRSSSTPVLGFSVCAKRTDADKGWRINLTISCTRRPLVPKWPHDVPTKVQGASHIIPVGKRSGGPLPGKAMPVPSVLGGNQPPAAVGELGHHLCPCIDAGLSGVATVGGKEVFFALHMGAKCAAWDDGKAPGCEDEMQTPGLGKGRCAKRWCYVDPCNCDIDTPPLSVGEAGYFKGATYKDKPLFYSEETCLPHDSAPKPSRCMDAYDEASCAGVLGCTWHGHRCGFKELRDTCSTVYEGSVVNFLMEVSGICCGSLAKSSHFSMTLVDTFAEVLKPFGIKGEDVDFELADNCSLNVSINQGDALFAPVAATLESTTTNDAVKATFLKANPAPVPIDGCGTPGATVAMLESGLVNATLNLSIEMKTAPFVLPGKDGFDCGSKNETMMKMWSKARKEFCCKEEGVACDIDAEPQCWEPHDDCSPTYGLSLGAEGSARYVGCLADAEKAFCGVHPWPFSNNPQRKELRECTRTSCENVCFEPVEACLDLYEHQGDMHSGCIRKQNGAWCKTSRESNETAFCRQIPCKKSCWRKPDKCVDEFTFNDTKHSKCVEHGRDRPWCSLSKKLSLDGDKWAYCKQTLCNASVSGSSEKKEASMLAKLPTLSTFDENISQSENKTASMLAEAPALSKPALSKRAPRSAFRLMSAIGTSAAATSDGASLLEVSEHIQSEDESIEPTEDEAMSSELISESEGTEDEAMSSELIAQSEGKAPFAGVESCPCLGIRALGYLSSTYWVSRKTGAIEQNVEDPDNYDNQAYQHPVGAYCHDWHRVAHPLCTGTRAVANKWCKQQWCFVDPCKCTLKDAYRKSTLFNATYQGKPLAYSYLACNATDYELGYDNSSSNSSADEKEKKSRPVGARTDDDAIPCLSETKNAANMGMYNCRCVGIAAPGVLSTTIEDSESKALLSVSGDFGSSCRLWQAPKNLTACYSDTPPSYCRYLNSTKPWCFVDPCECALSVNTDGKALFTAGFAVHSRFYHISRATCQPKDEVLWARNASRTCSIVLNKKLCQRNHKCKWISTFNASSDVPEDVSGYCVDVSRAHCPPESLQRLGLAYVSRKHISTTKAQCDERMCLFGQGLRFEAYTGEITCEQTPCSVKDIKRCCEPMGSCEDFGQAGCGARGLLKSNPEHRWCSSPNCNSTDYGWCCDDRALCTNFTDSWCPSGFKPLRYPERGTCKGLTCAATADFQACCALDHGNVIIAMVSGLVVSSIFAAAVSIGLIRYKKAKAVISIERAKVERLTKIDIDGDVVRFKRYREKHKWGSDEECRSSWDALPVEPDRDYSSTIIKKWWKGYKTRHMLRPILKERRLFEGHVVSFSVFRVLKKGMAIKKVKDEFFSLPMADGSEPVNHDDLKKAEAEEEEARRLQEELKKKREGVATEPAPPADEPAADADAPPAS
eukprot:TRINITY_DN4328_c0_g2_i2.p1 TRINITY_DN4328_c0_g2~~TRINITY_DN4328_c0_g2_i2.p1  ORF type:complete len:2095 (-),score=209.23 TRINITY_DN4328_c0_g2_i2:68-6352(-)